MNELQKTLIDRKIDCNSIWFMRQAGRYLPEFRKIRSKNKDFIKLCFNSDLSSEITLQPIERFDLDSAIIFSDILLVPHVLGQNVKFIKNKGPVLESFNLDKFLKNNPETFTKKMRPVYQAIKKTRKKLNNNKSLISFVGAPWTLITYMFGKDKKENIKNIFKDKKKLKIIIDNLISYLCLHIKNQINAGSDVVQVFDSWAGMLEKRDLQDFCFQPNHEIVSFCNNNKVPVICFPKGINTEYLNFNREDSGKISFLLSIPALAGASFLGLKNIPNETIEINMLVISAIILSFLFSFLTVKFFLDYIKKFSLNIFVIYRIVIAFILIKIIYF